MKPRLWLQIVVFIFFILQLSSIESKSQKYSRPRRELKRVRQRKPKLTRTEWEQLHKFEDALKSEDGNLYYTNSWAVQLDPAELEVADRLAKKHGFENLGQVCVVNNRLNSFMQNQLSVRRKSQFSFILY